ncbi:MAG: anaerobic ribonucleoside-triphosphate reductase activating protein [Treponema sp.]|nr:anaerobic ribonucleoside-triphosphate reductase activating protein [Treponema sp.]
MQELPLNRPAGVLVKTTCVDYPGRLAGSFFLKGCNIRCPYCYNKELVLENLRPDNLNTIQEVFDHLEKRQGILSGFVISGGEPLLNPYTPLIIKKAKELGYKVKIDTNGTLPGKLKTFIENPELKPDFIAMDIKCQPKKYASIISGQKSPLYGKVEFFEKVLKESIDLIKEYPPENREWRTVLVPGLVEKEDIEYIASILPQDASWQFAQFMNKNCLDPNYDKISPYTESEALELIKLAQKKIAGAALR